MNLYDWLRQNLHNWSSQLLFFLLALVAWIAFVATVSGWASGWFRLAKHFPNRSEKPLLQLRWQSGTVGPSPLSDKIQPMRTLRLARQPEYRQLLILILMLGVCPSGLRVGTSWWSLLFARDFFVPWEAIRVTRRENGLLMGAVELQFGNPAIGSLILSERAAERLVNAGARFVMPSS